MKIIQIGIFVLSVSVNACIISYIFIIHTNSTNKCTFNVKTFTFCDEKSIFSSKWYDKWKLWVHLDMDMEWVIMSIWVSCDAHCEPWKISVNNASKSLNERMGMSTYVFQLIIIVYYECWKCKMELVFDWRFSTLIIVLTMYLTSGYSHCRQTIKGREIEEKRFIWKTFKSQTYLNVFHVYVWMLQKEVSTALICNLLKRFSLH